MTAYSLVDRIVPRTELQVFSVGTNSAQIVWGRLDSGGVRVTATVDGESIASIDRDHPGGPGGVSLEGLPPDSQVVLGFESGSANRSWTVRTLAPPPGLPMCRFATISDLHLGAERFGLLKTMRDPAAHGVPHPLRCARAAIREAVRWGAELLLIKGDTVNHEEERHFRQLAQLVDEFPELDMILIPGNHDVDRGGGVIPLSVGRRSLPFVRNVQMTPLKGIGVLVADTTVPDRGPGSVGRIRSSLLEAVAGSDGPVFIGLHHQLQVGRLPRYWPVGIRAPYSTALLDDLGRLAKPVFVASGHTHRNRLRRHGHVVVSEVGSTKDWPGVWAGYEVFEGGLTQIVRRVEHPPAATWHEYSRTAVLGVWSAWSPGSSADRDASITWSGYGTEHAEVAVTTAESRPPIRHR